MGVYGFSPFSAFVVNGLVVGISTGLGSYTHKMIDDGNFDLLYSVIYMITASSIMIVLHTLLYFTIGYGGGMLATVETSDVKQRSLRTYFKWDHTELPEKQISMLA
jgi:hypothetical protein